MNSEPILSPPSPSQFKTFLSPRRRSTEDIRSLCNDSCVFPPLSSFVFCLFSFLLLSHYILIYYCRLVVETARPPSRVESCIESQLVKKLEFLGIAGNRLSRRLSPLSPVRSPDISLILTRIVSFYNPQCLPAIGRQCMCRCARPVGPTCSPPKWKAKIPITSSAKPPKHTESWAPMSLSAVMAVNQAKAVAGGKSLDRAARASAHPIARDNRPRHWLPRPPQTTGWLLHRT